MNIIEPESDAVGLRGDEWLAEVLEHDVGPARSAIEDRNIDVSGTALDHGFDALVDSGRFEGVVEQVDDRLRKCHGG